MSHEIQMPHLRPINTRLANVSNMLKRVEIRTKVLEIDRHTRNESWLALRAAANELAALMNNFCQDAANTPPTGEKQPKEKQCMYRN